MSSQYGKRPLTAEIRWRVWGIPANFNGSGVVETIIFIAFRPVVNK